MQVAELEKQLAGVDQTLPPFTPEFTINDEYKRP